MLYISYGFICERETIMKVKKLTSGAVYVIYGMIMLEGILMATPFGLFLYSFYLPFLEGVRQSALTAWIAAFFLPQSVYATSSTLIEFIRWKGQYLFYIGLIGFFAFAIQVYWAKFRRKGMVNNFVYSYIRHPQYLFFILSGVGLIFIWPRMMMLILFTIMSIFYFYLAKFEERRMQAKHPEYAEYMKKTAMFIPGNPGGKIFNLLFGWIPNQKIAHLIAVVFVIIFIFSGAIGLRNLLLLIFRSLKYLIKISWQSLFFHIQNNICEMRFIKPLFTIRFKKPYLSKEMSVSQPTFCPVTMAC